MNPPKTGSGKGSKHSEKDHLAQYYKQTGKQPEQVAGHSERPEELDYLYRLFCDLWNAGQGDILYSEIVAYQSLMQVNIRPWEIGVIQRLSVIFKRG